MEVMKNQTRNVVLKAHGETYGEYPYAIPLDKVANIAKPYGETAEVIAYLHDVIEGTGITAHDF